MVDFNIVQIIGKGTFGVVYDVTLQSTNEDIAIKKIIQDENYKNRELDLDHPNVVKMSHYYFTREGYKVGRAIKRLCISTCLWSMCRRTWPRW